MILETGIIISFDSTTHTADVQLIGSMSHIIHSVPVAHHLNAPILETGAACAVAFFAEDSQALIFATFGGALPPANRGWTDDFMGDALHPQYTTVSAGAGSTGFLWPGHGGIYVMYAGAAAWAAQVLWLGDATDGYPTLDADLGWLMMAKMGVSATTDVMAQFGANDAAWNDVIRAGLDTQFVANNWILQTRTAGGAWNTVDTGVPAAAWVQNRHVLNVHPISGGLRQVDYFLDGAQIATTTISVPTILLTPMVRVTTYVDVLRELNLDTWITIPRNLTA